MGRTDSDKVTEYFHSFFSALDDIGAGQTPADVFERWAANQFLMREERDSLESIKMNHAVFGVKEILEKYPESVDARTLKVLEKMIEESPFQPLASAAVYMLGHTGAASEKNADAVIDILERQVLDFSKVDRFRQAASRLSYNFVDYVKTDIAEALAKIGHKWPSRSERVLEVIGEAFDRAAASPSEYGGNVTRSFAWAARPIGSRGSPQIYQRAMQILRNVIGSEAFADIKTDVTETMNNMAIGYAKARAESFMDGLNPVLNGLPKLRV